MRRAPTWAYREDDNRNKNNTTGGRTPGGNANNPRSLSRSSKNSFYNNNSPGGGDGGGGPLNPTSSSSSFPQNNNNNNNNPATSNPDDPNSIYDYIGATTAPSTQSTLQSTLSSILNQLLGFSSSTSNNNQWTIARGARLISLLFITSLLVLFLTTPSSQNAKSATSKLADFRRPKFVYDHPYVSSSYYVATGSEKTLKDTARKLKEKTKTAKSRQLKREPKTRLAVVRPFCEFDAEALPTTFACWDSLVPCKAATADLGDDEMFSLNGTSTFQSKNVMADAAADVFLFYSQTFSDNPVAMASVDSIINTFNDPGGWSQCFENIYAIEANIPQELDLYIPSAQEELYNWVNGPNRQYEAAFRIIQSGEWGHYDGFYLMEGDSIPIKSHWLDQVLGAIEENRPFAILGAKYNGDKWDNFYESIPLSLLHHINGNAIYNTSHPLLERLVGQLEVEAPCPYNSIPYDYRMSQMVVEGALGIVPKLAPKIMLNDDGENITLSNNTEMFARWWDMYKDATPFKETPVIHNYAATNLIPRHLGPEYIIHGAKLYSPWDPTQTEITLVISEWFHDRSSHLLSQLDNTDHPFSEVIVMLPPDVEDYEEYNMTVVPTRAHHRSAPDYMDLCEAPVKTDWFMLTNSYHHVATHVDLMFTPATFKPVIPFTPATFPFCLKFPYCKEAIMLAQRIHPGHEKVVQDFDMLYHTATRNKFCQEWKDTWGEEGEDLYKRQKMRLLRRKKIIGPKGPTGTSYTAYLFANKKDGMYKLTDRSLYGARDPFIKIFAKEEKLDGMTDDERAARMGALGDNATADCNCKAFESRAACEGSGLGCTWRKLFESCHPPEMIDDGVPICPQTTTPTMSPTVALNGPEGDSEEPTDAPTKAPSESEKWFGSLFRVREHEVAEERREKAVSGGDGEEEEEDVVTKKRKHKKGVGEDGEENEFELEEEEGEDNEGEENEEGEDEEEGDTEEEEEEEEELSSSESNATLTKDSSSSNTIEDISSSDATSKSRRLSDIFTSRRRKLEVLPEDHQAGDPLLLQKMEQHYWNQVSSKRNLTVSPYIPKAADEEEDENNPQKLIAVSESHVNLKDLEVHYLNSLFRKNDDFAKHLEDVDEDGRFENRRRLSMSRSDDPAEDAVEDEDDDDGMNALEKMNRHFTAMMNEKLKTDASETEVNIPQPPQETEQCPTWTPSIIKPLNSTPPSPLTHLIIPSYNSSIPHIAIPSHPIGLSTPISIPSSLISIDYQNRHPFEGGEFNALFEETTDYYQPLRITFHSLFDGNDHPSANLEAILRHTSQLFSRVLRVIPLQRPLVPRGPKCGEATIPTHHLTNGINDTDMVIYLTSSHYCSNDHGSHVFPSICHFDQHMRPLVGSMALCMEEELKEDDLVFDVGRMLGWSPSLWSYYRHPDTGVPWGVTRNQRVTCGDDGSERIMDLPAIVTPSEGGLWIKSPTVVQVARNQFDCQTVVGVKWGTGGSNGISCFGEWFDERYFRGEGLFSPLSLSLLEDSSWYKVDYESVRGMGNSFGRGSGCGFVKGGCLEEDGSVPEYGKVFFGRGVGCDEGRWGVVESVDEEKEEETNNDDKEECPVRRKRVKMCSDTTQKPSLPGEAFGDQSRCFETNAQQPVCLDAFCSPEGKVKMILPESDMIITCDYEGMMINVGDEYEIECPRAAVFCPREVCPSNCSGRGVCDYCREVPECVCDDPFDLSEGCWGLERGGELDVVEE